MLETDAASYDQPKHAGGRPSLYHPEYCQQVEEQMGLGYSLGAFAGLIGVNRDTLKEWQAVHPEFAAAVSRAKAKRLAKWELAAMKGAFTQEGGNATLLIFGLKNAGRNVGGDDEWAEKSEVKHSGASPRRRRRSRVPSRNRLAGSGSARGCPSWSTRNAAINAYEAGVASGDPVKLAATYASNGELVSPFGLVAGQDALVKTFASFLKTGDKELETITSSRVVGDVALCSGEWTYTPASGGPVGKGYWTKVVGKVGNDWKIHVLVYNVAPSK